MKIKTEKELLQILEALVEWADFTGGWESKPWQDAREAVYLAKNAGCVIYTQITHSNDCCGCINISEGDKFNLLMTCNECGAVVSKADIPHN